MWIQLCDDFQNVLKDDFASAEEASRLPLSDDSVAMCSFLCQILLTPICVVSAGAKILNWPGMKWSLLAAGKAKMGWFT